MVGKGVVHTHILRRYIPFNQKECATIQIIAVYITNLNIDVIMWSGVMGDLQFSTRVHNP